MRAPRNPRVGRCVPARAFLVVFPRRKRRPTAPESADPPSGSAASVQRRRPPPHARGCERDGGGGGGRGGAAWSGAGPQAYNAFGGPPALAAPMAQLAEREFSRKGGFLCFVGLVNPLRYKEDASPSRSLQPKVRSSILCGGTLFFCSLCALGLRLPFPAHSVGLLSDCYRTG